MAISYYNHKPYSLGAAPDLLKETDARAQDLQRAMNVLPRVDRSGNSDCPFASQLFADAERAREALGWCLGRLVEFAAAADTEIRRCQVTRNKIVEDTRRLYGQHAKGYYQDSVRRMDGEVAAHTRTRDQLRRKATHVQALLNSSVSAILPGERPSRYAHLPDAAVAKSTSLSGPTQAGRKSRSATEDLVRVDLQRAGDKKGTAPVYQPTGWYDDGRS